MSHGRGGPRHGAADDGRVLLAGGDRSGATGGSATDENSCVEHGLCVTAATTSSAAVVFLISRFGTHFDYLVRS